MEYLTTILEEPSYLAKKCECDVINYYCYCDGEDKLLDELKQIDRNNFKFKYCIFNVAVCYGHLNIVKWMRLNSLVRHWDTYTCDYAARNGHLNILIWLRSQEPPCFWDENTIKCASKNNHLDIIKWLYTQNPPCPSTISTYDQIIKYGYFNIFKWLIDNNIINDDTILYVNRYCEIHIHCLKYLFEINRIDMLNVIQNEINLQQIQRMKILMSGVF